ncbi:DUF4760 domain-containing protein [Parasphingorhabdus sp.]|uniref:DUF4760 domain-containing protein n=1 Tax=Parasphingorhabdus sp. TaxID=2709688 RepID=UPI002B27761E|nr:DUF4760 domain-containing protein [Parasphingorhabdus sp.]
MGEIEQWLVTSQDILASIAALATAFAFLVQLPAYFVVKYIGEREQRRERAYKFIDEYLNRQTGNLQGRLIVQNLSSSGESSVYDLCPEDRAKVMVFMNDNERIAHSVLKKRLDEKVIMSWFHTTFVKDWETAAPIVSEIRGTGRPNLFVEWERLAKRWSNPH